MAVRDASLYALTNWYSKAINMTVLNVNKLSFYVVLLSVAFAQILVVSAAENNLDSDNVDVTYAATHPF